MGASEHAPTRFLRAKALAERAVAASSVPSTVFAPSIVYSPDNYWVRLMERLTLLPAVPISGPGDAKYQPIWAEDVVDCVLAALRQDGDRSARYELAGPETLTYDDMARLVMRSAGRRRRLLHVPLPIARAGLRAHEAVMRGNAAATWDEAMLMETSMTSSTGTADADKLGVSPLPMREVLGAS
jgi:NADH dehydrogenase